MDSRKLASFVEVIEQGSINRAAESLRISQPALSKTIRFIELDLGVKLIERSGKGVRPTAHGKVLYSYAKAVVAELNSALAEIRSLRQDEEKEVAIGVLGTLSVPILAPALARLHAARQRLPPLRVVERPEMELISELRRGAFDFVLGIVSGGEPAAGFVERSLFVEQRKVLVRRGHPLLTRGQFQPSDLIEYPWILPLPGTIHRQPIDELFRSAGLKPPEPTVIGASFELVKRLLLTTDHIVTLSVHAAAAELDSGTITALPIALPALRRTIGIVHREFHPIPSSVAGLISEIEFVCQPLAERRY